MSNAARSNLNISLRILFCVILAERKHKKSLCGRELRVFGLIRELKHSNSNARHCMLNSVAKEFCANITFNNLYLMVSHNMAINSLYILISFEI